MDKEIIWIIRGVQRKGVFLNLPDKSFLPNKFRKELNNKNMTLSLREMSRHLKDFEGMNLVHCINKKDPYSKIYQVTAKGKRMKKELLKLNI